MTLLHLLGGLAAAFAALLIVLPSLRVAQGRLRLREVLGLWVSGFGFLLLALAALALSGEAARLAVLTGVIGAVTGNIVQRRNARG
jgi:hypothetical protein